MRKKTFVIKSRPKNLKILRRQLKSFLVKTRFSAKDKWRFLVAITEACTNSIRHAYKGKSSGVIRIQVCDQKDRILFRIRDYGVKIDPRRIRNPSLPKKKPHGLGLFFLRKIMDEFYYRTDHKKGNEIFLVKHKRS